MGSGLCLHLNVFGARGDDSVLLNGLLPDGAEEIHGSARGAEEVPVRSG